MNIVEREIYLQVELYADEENDFVEIKRKKRMVRAALTTWKENLDACERRILQWESGIRSTMNEVYTLVSLFSVFEGVVLTAVAQSIRLECQHLWSPVDLSLFAYSMVVIVAFTKFREIQALKWGKNTRERPRRLKTVGYANFDFDRDCQRREYDEPKVPFWRNALGLIVPFTIFTMGLVVSFIPILCWS